jgi:hypothetical protein
MLATAGGGVFAHISDSTMVLTTFVNWISALKACPVGRLRLHMQTSAIADGSHSDGSGGAAKAEPDVPAPEGGAAGAAITASGSLLAISRVWGRGAQAPGTAAL